jgi:hypothetical protein
MAINLGSAYGKISLDVSGLLNGVTKSKDALQSMAGMAQQVGNTMRNVGNAMTIGLTLPIVAMGAAAIKNASSLEETKNKVSVLFGEMTGDIMEWSKTSIDSVNMWQGKALDAASSMFMFGDAAGLGKKAATEFAKANVQLSADLSSFFDTSPDEALNAIAAAYRGEMEPIRRYNVLINQAAVEQKAVQMGLMGANGELSQQAKILAVNALIMEQTTAAQGDLARTSESVANQIRKAKEQIIQVSAEFGENLLPIVTKVLLVLNKVLKWFMSLPESTQNVILVLAGLVAIMGPLLSMLGTIVSLGSGIVGLVGGLPAMAAALGAIATTITATVIPAIVAVGSALLPILVVIAAMILVAGLLAIAWKTNFMGIRDTVATTVSIIKSLWRALGAFLHGDTKAMQDALKEAFNTYVDHINKIFEKLFGVKDAVGKFLEWVRNIFNNLVSWISGVFSKTNWAQLGKSLLFGIANGMLGGIPMLVVAATKAAEAALATIKAKLGIKSPSKAFEQLGIYSAQGYQLGLARAMNPDDIARTMARPVNQMASSQQQTFINYFSSGLTTRDVQSMIDVNVESLVNTMSRAIGGA